MSNSMLILLSGLLGEIVLLALVLLGIAYLRNRAQRRRDLKAVQTLIARIKNGKAEREKAIVQFLEQGMSLSGEALQQAKVAILRGELGMVQRIAGVYRLRDAAGLARIDDELYAAIGPYHALSGAAVQAAGGEAAPVDDDELERLRQENRRLSEELTITMETMSRMLNEYSSVFAGDAPDGEDVASATGEDPAESAPVPDDAQAGAEEVVIAAMSAAETQDSADVSEGADGIEAPSDHDDPLDVEDVIAAPMPAPDDRDAAVAPETAAHAGVTETPVERDAAEETAADEDDEIAAIIREAQTQETSARDSADVADAMANDDEDGAAEVVTDEETSPLAGLDAAADASVDVVEDLDDLFDASGDDVADVIVDGVDAAADSASEADAPLTSRGGG